MRHPITRAFGAALLTATLVLSVTACGDDGGSGSDSSDEVSTTEHNGADSAFATDMIQHHAQALAMVDLTMGRQLDPDVQRLADGIRIAQTPEIETMAGWLEEWGEEVPATMRDHANADHDDSGADMGGTGDMSDSMEGMDTDMPGMMSADEMDSLANASDEEFTSMWLEMMIEHHTGAIEMARAEQADGRYRPALDLAGSIVTAQAAEIETMRRLLG